MEFNSDGTIFYTISADTQRVNQFILTTPYDISTATFSKYTSVSGYYNIKFKPDGTRFYITDYSMGNSRVVQYELSTPWDITTVSTYVYKNVTNSNYRSLSFSSDGTKMYTSGSSNIFYQYTLSTPWDATTATFSTSITLNAYFGSSFDDTGTSFYIYDTGGTIYQYTLSTPWDISTATLHNTKNSLQSGYSMTLGNNGNDVYIGTYHKSIFEDPALTWYDNSAGIGNIMICVYIKLFDGLKNIITNDKKRQKHIIENHDGH